LGKPRFLRPRSYGKIGVGGNEAVVNIHRSLIKTPVPSLNTGSYEGVITSDTKPKNVAETRTAPVNCENRKLGLHV
jgi:hypothetical protein